MAFASGCSLPWSTLAAMRNTSSSVNGAMASAFANTGLPRVSVPVLSTISVSMRRSVSSASASRNSTPLVAARPLATMIDIGVASPSAQGQAMISTETAFSTAYAPRGSGPNCPQAIAVTTAIVSTASTK